MATIADVAERAGVSLSTVSYVLSGKRPISLATRKRVESAIQALNYRPNAGARALAMARTNVIGLMVPLRTGVDLNVIMQFVAGITASAHERQYDVLLVTHGDESNLTRVAGSAMIDGLLVMDVEESDPRLNHLRRLPFPIVLIGVPAAPDGLTCIDFDFAAAGALAARHLLELGHRGVALFGSPAEVLERRTSYAVRMNHGFADEAISNSAEHLEISVMPSAAGARDAVERLLAAGDAFTGIVVHNEVALPHIVAELRAHGIAIPTDRSIIAIGPANVTQTLPSPITAIDIPAGRIGGIAVGMLAERLAEHAAGHASDAEIRLLGPTLTHRGSTAPTPAH